MRKFVFLVAFLFLSLPLFAQQEYVPRFDAFTGFSYLASPGDINLYQRGFNGELGVNVNRWLALGGDFSIFTGHSSLIPGVLDPSIQASLAPIIFLVPPGFLNVPFDATTYTFTAGPQINFRHWRYVTLFVRPAIGGIHETATLNPNNPVTIGLVQVLAPSGEKSDTTIFYGVGGGFDINASKHVALRMSADYVHVHLFDGFLKDPRNSVRLSIGPAFRWGRNVE